MKNDDLSLTNTEDSVGSPFSKPSCYFKIKLDAFGQESEEVLEQQHSSHNHDGLTANVSKPLARYVTG